MWRWNNKRATSVRHTVCESSPTRFEPITSQIPGGRSIHLSYLELKESEANYTRFIFDTRPAYCITSNLVSAQILEPYLE